MVEVMAFRAGSDGGHQALATKPVIPAGSSDLPRPLTPARLLTQVAYSRPLRALRPRALPTRVKVHGPLRAGTNYVAALLGANTDGLPYGDDVAGWKHGRILHVRSTPVVVVVREPFSWARSFHRWEIIHGRATDLGLATFLRMPVTHRRFRHEWGAAHPIDGWNRSVADWLAASQRWPNVAVVRYEDVRADLTSTLHSLGETLGLSVREDEITDVTTRVDAWPTPHPRPRLDRQRPVYGRNEMPPDAVESILDRVDADVCDALGYDVGI